MRDAVVITQTQFHSQGAWRCQLSLARIFSQDPLTVSSGTLASIRALENPSDISVEVLSHSVVSDSLQPHRLQPARLLCPWGFSRQEYWSGLPCPAPRDLPNPGIEPRSPTLQEDSLTTELSGKPISTNMYVLIPTEDRIPVLSLKSNLALTIRGSKPWILEPYCLS